MIRALTTLIGLGCAAALLLLVNDTGSAEGGGLWGRAALLAGAGLAAGFFYQLGGIRRPGVRLNAPLLIGAFVPWSLLAVAICAHRAGTPVWLSDVVHDILPDSVLTRWSPSFSILAFADGLLLAFALVEPLVQGERVTTVAASVEDAPPRTREVVFEEDPAEPTEVRPA